MKIVLIIKALSEVKGGAERVFADVASGLAALGHDVTAISFDQKNALPFYPIGDRVKRINLAIGNSLEKARPLETARRIIALRRSVLAERPDIVVAFMHSMFVPAAIALAGSGIPVIGSEHIVPDHYKTRRMEFYLFLLSSLLLKKITVLSERIKASYPLPIRRKMIVLPNPVQPARFFAAPDQDKADNIILNVGRLDPQKDQATLIHAFASLHDRFPGWTLRIVGEGPLRQNLQHLIARHELTEKVTLCGTTPDISPEYQKASIFALPSLYESFGLATAEAMAHGLPVIGFADCEGTREIVTHGKNGLLAPGDDRIGALAKALEQLMSSPEQRGALGAAGKSSVAGFAPQRIIDRWDTLLEDIAVGRP